MHLHIRGNNLDTILHIYRRSCSVETICKYYTTLFKRLQHLCILMSLWVQDPVPVGTRKRGSQVRWGAQNTLFQRLTWVSKCWKQKAYVPYLELSYLPCSCLDENVPHRLVGFHGGPPLRHCSGRLWDFIVAEGNPSRGQTGWPANLGLPQALPPTTEMTSFFFYTGRRSWTQILILCYTHWVMFSALQYNILMRYCINFYFILKSISDQGVHSQQSHEISGHHTGRNSTSGLTGSNPRPPEGTFRKTASVRK